MNASANHASAFRRKTREQLKALKRDCKRVHTGEGSERVHRVRKRTRRLQVIVDALAAVRPTKKLRQARKRLKRCRRALGGWRDSEVMLGRVAQLAKDAGRPGRRRWNAVAARLIRTRATQERKVMRQRSLRIQPAARDLKKIMRGGVGNLAQGIEALMGKAWPKWNDAIQRALNEESVATLHAVRIKTKTLRYIIEGRQQLSPDSGLEASVAWLKRLQDQLGAWHDELNLNGSMTACFASRRLRADPGVQRLLNESVRRETDGAAACRRMLMEVEGRCEYRIIRERQGSHAEPD
ncbi:MAG: CHAD domain-containing protein [Candidatus Binataceae bacterium]